jgi:hypothetical protein
VAWRIRRTVKIAPGIRLNINKRGPSVRFGPKGVGMTVGPHGHRVSAGVPGTGVYVYQQYGRKKSGSRQTPSEPRSAAVAAVVPKGERWPIGWAITGAIATFLAVSAFASHASGPGLVLLLLAGGCATAVYARLASATYKAAALVRRAATLPITERLPLLEEALRIAPRSAEARMLLAHAYLELERPVDAVAILNTGLETQPGDERLTLELAGARLAARDYAGVLASLEPKLASLDPEQPYAQQALLLAAEALRESGDPGRGLEVIKRAPLRRHTLDTLLQFCLLARATCALDAGRRSEAKRDLDRLYALDPEFPGLEEALARASAGGA